MDKLPLAVVGVPTLTGNPVTLVGEGRRRHSLVAMRDAATYAIAALHRATTERQTLLIGGPQPCRCVMWSPRSNTSSAHNYPCAP